MPLSGQDGLTPLHWATEHGVVRMLLDAGADQDAQDQVPRAGLQRESRGGGRVQGEGYAVFDVQ